MAKYKVLPCPYSVPRGIISSMVKRDKVTVVISQQVGSYLAYLENRQIAINVLIGENNRAHQRSKLSDGLLLFKSDYEEVYNTTYERNKLILYKIQFLIGLLRFSFYGIRSDEIEDAKCDIKTLYEMLKQSDPRGRFFLNYPISDEDYRFDNIHIDSLGLDSWFGPDSVVFEEKPSCGLM